MLIFDKGSVILQQAEVRKREPFGKSSALIDPTSIKLTVEDPTGNKKVDGVAMTKKEVGLYYHLIQTTANWASGVYKVSVEITHESLTDITVDYSGFKLR